ncbi:uncharacterized protein FOBCDRAFT_315640 [Fusarium oxysporum Fo47]|uniref:Uncharacterized protein n=1 Tax=Fusarium oxysporum Fo47 TaxID=660027 RepID=W9L2I9_FUSOX|nr:uncharacterized protein FOBCDRAFT_315640 [Fusarium oxysporum Fo47]EWZ47488.1 hypothetical protein FOZG_03400 [Fusarium oxysporum Fo47]EWZ92535.1 hypothetical protein FOWG_05636 [Fusarium oxysporum f. sp. lycopersici MN25]QKD49512.1 hypothetical protein FOBCDRAFT_315640 [Fusarium oxysporum Fo47]
MIALYFLPFVLWACLGQAILTPRKPFDTAFYVFNGAWSCSQDQLKTISGAIDEAHDLSKAAINVLSKPSSEQSIAFESWFGSSNGTPNRRDIILKRHFQAVLENLIPSTAAAQFRLSHSPFLNPQQGSTITESSLVYACPPPSEPVCDGNTVAAVQSATGSRAAVFGATLLVLCPDFFGNKPNLDSAVQLWKTEHTLGDNLSRGFALVHEVQHMIQATESEEERCDDLQDPFEDNKDCYSASCCFRLSDAQKLKNAQNYAIYALDVLAFPDTAGSPSSSCNLPQKREEVPFLNFFKRQAQPLPESVPPAPFQNTSASFITFPKTSTEPLSSEVPVTPTSNVTTPGGVPTEPVTSGSPITTSFIETATTSSAAPTTTVSDGATVVVSVGAVVVGGPGGGFISVGGALIPVAAGAVVTAKPEDEQKPTDPDDKSTEPTSTPTPTSTSTESESCSVPTTTATYGSEGNAVCRDLSGMSNEQLLQLIPQYGQVSSSAEPAPTSTPGASNTTAIISGTPSPSTFLTTLAPKPEVPISTVNTTSILVTIPAPNGSSTLVTVPSIQTPVPFIGDTTNCNLTDNAVPECQNLVNGKRACLYSQPKGFLCVADCPAGDPCLQTCQTMNYKGGYCSNGTPSCVCSNDDPTA